MDPHSARPQRISQEIDHGEGAAHEPKAHTSHCQERDTVRS